MNVKAKCDDADNFTFIAKYDADNFTRLTGLKETSF